MIPVDQLKRFSGGCLNLRQHLQTGSRLSESEYNLLRAHIHTLLAYLEKNTDSESRLQAMPSQETRIAS